MLLYSKTIFFMISQLTATELWQGNHCRCENPTQWKLHVASGQGPWGLYLVAQALLIRAVKGLFMLCHTRWQGEEGSQDCCEAQTHLTMCWGLGV